jgi:ankyrin repeat protein
MRKQRSDFNDCGNGVMNAIHKDGDTALMLATTKGHSEIVQALLNYGAIVNTTDQVRIQSLWR